MTTRSFPLLGLAATVALSGLTACGGDGGAPRVIAVPGDVATIAEAVESARPGTTIEIAPGMYSEAVVIDTPGITIRGTDRSTVILDGEHRLGNGISITADDVAVENLTVRNYLQNGVLFNGIAAASDGAVDPGTDYGTGDDVLDAYRVSYVTTHNNGLYGVYAFAARRGLIEHSYASGHPDSGFYIGQCKPCDVVIDSVVAERNAIGYYGTNASGGVVIARSVFRNNRLGIAPNSQDMERLAPQADATVVGNLVVDNDDPTAPSIPDGYFGGGIAIGGGTRNLILRNRVEGHDRAGIELLSLSDYRPEGNRIEDNVLADNAVDLAFAVAGANDASGNCFVGNTFATSVPAAIEDVMPCDAATGPIPGIAPLTLAEPPRVDYRAIPAPGPQPSMPAAERRDTAGAGVIPTIDIAGIGVP